MYRFVSSATLQLLRMWFVVCLRLQSLHKSELDFFHLFKLAAVGRVSMEALRRNLSVPFYLLSF